MEQKVALIGLGYTPPAPRTPELSYKEMIYEAARTAYAEAGIEPEEVGSFVSVAEDIQEGTSIFDEYVPDQIGAVQKPVHTITGDGIQGIIAGCLQILTGQFDLVVVEGHSKASNVVYPIEVMSYALDPVLNRPLRIHPHYIAGLEMRAYMEENRVPERAFAEVVVKNRGNAARNRLAPHGGDITADDVLGSDPLFEPIRRLHTCPHSDAAYIAVLASEGFAAKRIRGGLWITGMGWCSDSPSLETRDWTRSIATTKAAAKAYRSAGISNPSDEIDVFEIDDSFAFKELQQMEALGLCDWGNAHALLSAGKTAIGGDTPVNPSGGSLGVGWMHEATGLHKVLEIARQLMGDAGELQVDGARVGLAQSWRGIPTTTSAVLILQGDE
jgi:acetyl-CoA C-acetyltransferase